MTKQYSVTINYKSLLEAVRAATTPADLEACLAEARAELSGSEYLGLRGKLSSASNVRD